MIHKGQPGTNPTAEAPFRNGITKEKAYELYLKDLNTAADAVRKYVKIDLTQNQFDALVSFSFNSGASKLKSSTLLKLINSKASEQEISSEWHKWIHSGGKKMAGLWNRKHDEVDMFFKADYKRNYNETSKSLGFK